MILRFSIGSREIKYIIQPATTIESIKQELYVIKMKLINSCRRT